MDEDKKNKLFGQLAVKLGYVTVADVKDALIKQETDEITGQRKHLGTYFFENGLLTKEQISQIIQLQKKYIEKLEQRQEADSIGSEHPGTDLIKAESEPISVKKLNQQVVEAYRPENHQATGTGTSANNENSQTMAKVFFKTVLKMKNICLIIIVLVMAYPIWLFFFTDDANKNFKKPNKNTKKPNAGSALKRSEDNKIAASEILNKNTLKNNEEYKTTSIDPLTNLINKAESGDAQAQLKLGGMYNKGEGVPKDYSKAAELFEKAAKQGDATAQNRLGAMYQKGKGVPQDYKKAFEFYEKAALQGNHFSQYNLGVMYSQGQGISEDRKKGFEWFEKAALQGDANAHYILGIIHAKGEIVPQDYVMAYVYFNLAAATNDKKEAIKFRDGLKKEELTPAQLEKAQEISKEFFKKIEENKKNFQEVE